MPYGVLATICPGARTTRQALEGLSEPSPRVRMRQGHNLASAAIAAAEAIPPPSCKGLGVGQKSIA
jgi:hypothetical protein